MPYRPGFDSRAELFTGSRNIPLESRQLRAPCDSNRASLVVVTFEGLKLAKM